MNEQQYAPPKANIEAMLADEPPVVGPVGLEGWLILVGIGLVVSPFRIARMLLGTHWPLFRDGTWALLTTEGSPSYDARWALVLMFEVLGNIFLLGLVLTTLVFFLRKSRKTPKLAIAWYACAAAFVLVDNISLGLLGLVTGPLDGESIMGIIHSVGVAAIWIPYFLTSERVENTFVR